MNKHNVQAGNCIIGGSNGKTGLAHCEACEAAPVGPTLVRALKVEGGKIVHAMGEGGTATAPTTTAVGVDAPDGTYLRLDYVQDLVRAGTEDLLPMLDRASL